MSKYFIRGTVILLIAILATVFTAETVLAADIRSGDNITIASGEVINEDLYVVGSDIIVDGTVNGDLIAGGGTITVNGTVNGSVIAAGGTININGEVTHAVRIIGGTLNISGIIGGDLLVAGGELSMASTAKIGGDLLFGAGTARIDGLIDGSTKAAVDSLTIASTASIRGNLTYISENEASIDSGAQIRGTITHRLPNFTKPTLFSEMAGKAIAFLMTLVTGIIIILVATRRTKSIADSMRNKPWPSLGYGALILFITPIAAIVLCITIVGIPLGIIGLVLYGIAIYLSQIPVALFIGRWIIGYFREVESKAILVGALASGLAILSLLKMIPYLGFIISLAAILLGLGALLVSERRLRVEAK